MKRLAISGWAFAGVFAVLSIILGVSTWDYRIAKDADNEKLKRAFNAVVISEGDGSCAVLNNGPVIHCWMEHGAVKTKLAPESKKRKRKS